MNENENLPTHPIVATSLSQQIKKKTYYICNTPATNNLHEKRTLIKKADSTNESIFEYAKGQGFLLIKNYENKMKNFDISTVKLFNYAIWELTKQNPSGQNIDQIKTQVEISIKDYLKKRGFKNNDRAKKQLIKDLDLLFDSSIDYKETVNCDRKGKKKIKEIWKTRLICKYKIEPYCDTLTLSVDHDLAKLLINKRRAMAISEDYFGMKPIPSEILHKLSTYAETNKWGSNKKEKIENIKKGIRKSFQIISVKSLLEGVGSIPSYEEVVKSKYHRNVKTKIIAPLIKGLEKLKENRDLLKWEVCNEKGKPLSEEQEKEKYKWKNFKKLYIKYELIIE
ncbi:MAG: hypothetical protein LBK92_04770 [Endomicrobium sp.]|jgi:hypothetical protein|nr:hypothetical protein [Endomicrobium sp.]